MTTNFGQWVKDPFFSAAEEVQESADRMESAYRRWLYGRGNDPVPVEDSDELRRELQTALGTTKWQLEEFERAVRSSYGHLPVDDARSRHRQFVTAIGSQVSQIEKSLRHSMDAEGWTNLSWVRLDEGERDELAAFLAGPVGDGVGADATASKDGDIAEAEAGCSTNSCRLGESGLEVKREVRSPGHRRTASADADVRSWNITIPGGDSQQGSLNMPPGLPPPRIFSFSGTSGSMESSYKQMPKNGFRKLKVGDRHHSADMELLQGQPLSRGIDCYEKSKSCLDSYDESYGKPLYGWLGALQRQLQRSQYQFQYSRPVQMAFSVVLIICLIGFTFLGALKMYGEKGLSFLVGVWSKHCSLDHILLGSDV